MNAIIEVFLTQVNSQNEKAPAVSDNDRRLDRKKLFFISLAIMLGLSACGNKEVETPEAVETQAQIETQAQVENQIVVETSEAVKDTVAEENNDKENKGEDDDKDKEEGEGEGKGKLSNKDNLQDNNDKPWKAAYLEIVQNWNDEHGEDSSIGYQLAYINDDDIPELVLMGDDEAWYGLDIYTYIDDKAVHMQTEGRYDQTSPLTSPGCQGKGDAYMEKDNIYIQTNGMMGSLHTNAYRMEGDTFVPVFIYAYTDLSWDESNQDPYSYTLEYTPVGGESILIEKKVSENDDYYDVESVPEAKDLEKEFGFSFDKRKGFGFEDTLTYDEILSELDQARDEA